ncbi:MAG: type I restriction endonuclease subunit S [Candidatus Electrothrix sp. GM3_4]|nr:type I restriction endonuclease subunit S [Candidatus Electrothrix sp. GM3_4]
MRYREYPAYKESGVEWLGAVPKNWLLKKFKYMALINNGKDYKKVETEVGGYPVIGSGGEFTRSSQYLFKGESVLLGRKGTIDRPLYINGSFWTVDTMFYTTISKNTFPKYLYYCAVTIPYDYYATQTALPSMTQADLSNNPFAFPTYEEQITISNFLDRETKKIDNLIAKQQKLIKLLREKRQAVISHAVTKGLDSDVKMKDSGVEWLGDVLEHWIVTRAKFVSNIFGNYSA